MILTNYQKSEIVIGTIVFSLLYFIYRNYITPTSYPYFDILYSTLGVFIILFLKNFSINYFQLYNSNI
jgi:hypothetical protein